MTVTIRAITVVLLMGEAAHGQSRIAPDVVTLLQQLKADDRDMLAVSANFLIPNS